MNILQYCVILALTGLISADVIIDGVLVNYSNRQFLDFKRKYSLEWTVNWSRKEVIFNISVATTGWVGIGFSKDGTMKNADIMMAGVTRDGKPYISDFHVDCDRNNILDASQDWRLLGARENSGRTFLQVSRLIDTCDPDDIPITEDLLSIIWAYGETDQLEYHYDKRGRLRAHLLDPVMHSAPSSKSLPKWKVSKRTPVPPKVTTYWCSIHKIPPTVNRKQHIIEFHPILQNEVAFKHVHHFVLWRCLVPRNTNPRVVFEHLLSFPGEECYFNDNHQIPINLCRTIVYVYAVGGEGIILPGDAGFPMEVETPYYMLEAHYNNPEKITGLLFEAGVEATYTNRLRSHDAGGFMIDYDLFGFFMVPPGTPKLDLQSHCDSRCTSEMFPARGIDVFAVQGHTHGSGRTLMLHHFRGGKELPWIYKDLNFDWTFQTTRPLQTERRILPGDHLSLSCSYDNTWTNTTTVSGFSSLDEMCLTMIYHKTPIPYYSCSGQVPQEKLLGLVGVQNTTWDQITQERIVTSPNSLSGKMLAEITDQKVFWSKQLRTTVAAVTLTSPQVIACPITTPPDEPLETVVNMARGYGDQTLMGSTPVPVVTPGPHSISGFPYSAKQYNRMRTCLV
ncbi:unnamed protein product [Orchesella dallaii]|uniref:DOMON domain-containing protein n=1 Tax=Orchesella dallaii TaxID=48710 RepID=A0ABP1PZN8_9HEXA